MIQVEFSRNMTAQDLGTLNLACFMAKLAKANCCLEPGAAIMFIPDKGMSMPEEIGAVLEDESNGG